MRTFSLIQRSGKKPRKLRFSRESLKVLHEPGGVMMVRCRYDATARALRSQGWQECSPGPAEEPAADAPAPTEEPAAEIQAEAPAPAVPVIAEPAAPPPDDIAPPPERRPHDALLHLPPVDFHRAISAGAHDDVIEVLIAAVRERRGPGDAMRIASLLSRCPEDQRKVRAVGMIGQDGLKCLSALLLPPFASPAPAEPMEEPVEAAGAPATLPEPEEAPAAPEEAGEPDAPAEPTEPEDEPTEEPKAAVEPEEVPQPERAELLDVGALTVPQLEEALLHSDDRGDHWGSLEALLRAEVQGKNRIGATNVITRAMLDRASAPSGSAEE